MQYILTYEEYKALQNSAQAGEQIKRDMPTVKELQELCSLVADHVPVKEGWYKDRIWGCILTTKKNWYCDDCPARKACPHPNKKLSK